MFRIQTTDVCSRDQGGREKGRSRPGYHDRVRQSKTSVTTPPPAARLGKKRSTRNAGELFLPQCRERERAWQSHCAGPRERERKEDVFLKHTLEKMAASKPSLNRDGQRLIPLGVRHTYVSCSTWEGQTLIHVRKYITRDGVWVPTQKGIAMNKEEFHELINQQPTILRQIEELEAKREEGSAVAGSATSSSSKKKKRKRKISSSTSSTSSSSSSSSEPTKRHK